MGTKQTKISSVVISSGVIGVLLIYSGIKNVFEIEFFAYSLSQFLFFLNLSGTVTPVVFLFPVLKIITGLLLLFYKAGVGIPFALTVFGVQFLATTGFYIKNVFFDCGCALFFKTSHVLLYIIINLICLILLSTGYFLLGKEKDRALYQLIFDPKRL